MRRLHYTSYKVVVDLVESVVGLRTPFLYKVSTDFACWMKKKITNFENNNN